MVICRELNKIGDLNICIDELKEHDFFVVERQNQKYHKFSIVREKYFGTFVDVSSFETKSAFIDALWTLWEKVTGKKRCSYTTRT